MTRTAQQSIDVRPVKEEGGSCQVCAKRYDLVEMRVPANPTVMCQWLCLDCIRILYNRISTVLNKL